MKNLALSIFDGFAVGFPSVCTPVEFGGRSGTAIRSTPSINSAMGFSMPDTPADGSSIMVKSTDIEECAPGDPITVGAFGHVVISHSLDIVGAIRTIAISQPFKLTATFTGTRREGASGSRELFISTPCLVTGGDMAGGQSNAIAPSSDRNFMLTVRSCDWSDSNPPHAGDAVEVTNYPALKVVESSPVLGGWNITCKTKGV